jgi:hypothetical protein
VLRRQGRAQDLGHLKRDFFLRESVRPFPRIFKLLEAAQRILGIFVIMSPLYQYNIYVGNRIPKSNYLKSL